MKTARKDLLKIIAVGAAGIIAGTSVTAATIGATKKKDDVKDTETTVSESTSAKDTKTAKDETVYVIANADGSVKKIIVSDWIKNSLNEKNLKDKSELKDIKNVKGDESYVMDSDNMRVWNADGADIYYQGTISKELPVDLKVSYKLDGKAVSADEIAGKSGKATIRFDYVNKQYSEVTIDGKTEKIYVPFVMLTGLMLDNDVFTNVEVSNGKLINDGDRTVVAGFALPGLKENLALDSSKIEIPDYVEVTADVKNFSLTTTLTLATNSLFNEFDTSKLNTADDLQAQLNELTSGMSKLIDGSSELYGGLTTLLSKSKELAAGVDKLASGTNELASGTAALNAGLNTLVSKNGDLTAGAAKVFDTLLATVTTQFKDNGITVSLTKENYKSELNSLLSNPTDAQKAELIAVANSTVEAKLKGNNVPEAYYKAVKVMLAEKLAAGKTLEAAMAEIAPVLTNAAEVKKALADDTLNPNEALINGLIQMGVPESQAGMIAKISLYLTVKNNQPLTSVTSNVTTAIAMATDAQTVSAAMNDSAADAKINALCLKLALSTLKPSVETAVTSLDSYNEFYQGILAYTAGVKSASDGSAKVNAGAAELKSGAEQLKAGTEQLVPGVEQLADGSKQLADGIKELNEKGISKITGLAGKDLQNLVDRVKATVEVSKSYKSFAGISDEADGSVKFIYKTDEKTACENFRKPFFSNLITVF